MVTLKDVTVCPTLDDNGKFTFQMKGRDESGSLWEGVVYDIVPENCVVSLESCKVRHPVMSKRDPLVEVFREPVVVLLDKKKEATLHLLKDTIGFLKKSWVLDNLTIGSGGMAEVRHHGDPTATNGNCGCS